MTLLAKPGSLNDEAQKKYKWKSLAVLFKAAICQSFGMIPMKSPLQIYLEAGLASLKTSRCQPLLSIQNTSNDKISLLQNEKKPNGQIGCPICSEPNLHSLAAILPYAKQDSSQIICRITGDIISGGGLSSAICLPNGQVFSEKAISEPDTQGFVSCPLTGDKFPIEQMKKIYFL